MPHKERVMDSWNHRRQFSLKWSEVGKTVKESEIDQIRKQSVYWNPVSNRKWKYLVWVCEYKTGSDSPKRQECSDSCCNKTPWTLFWKWPLPLSLLIIVFDLFSVFGAHIKARQTWSSWGSLKRSCKMQLRRRAPSQNLIFARFSRCNNNVNCQRCRVTGWT